jgi:hypothetical protein
MAQLLSHLFKRWNNKPDMLVREKEVVGEAVNQHELIDRESSLDEVK